jgi:hypothetical protein
MLSSELDHLTPIQSLFVEQALVMAKELETAADSAPEGHVIDRCESFMLGFGRGFLRRMLESTIQLRAESLEKSGAARACACGGSGQIPGTPYRIRQGFRGHRTVRGYHTDSAGERPLGVRRIRGGINRLACRGH